MLIGVAVRVIVQSLHVSILSSQRDIIEPTNSQCGLRVRRGDKAFFFTKPVSKQRLQ